MDKTYIRVIGQARYNEKRSYLIGFRIMPVEDPLEVEEHLLEAIADSVVLEKRSHELATDSTMDVDFKPTSAQGEALNIGLSTGFNDVENMVLNVLKKYSNYDLHPQGMGRQEIKQHLGGLDGSKVDKALEFLLQEGHLFSTIDDDTFQRADN